MDVKVLATALNTLGLPLTYSHFTNPPTPPYIVYTHAGNDDLMADDANYKEIESYQIELYSDKRDLVSEGLIQSKLKELNLPYSKIPGYIESEKLFQVMYTVQLI